MMIIGFLLIIITPILYYSLQGQSSTIYINQADDAVNTIANAVNEVYALGPGTKNYVWVTFPNNIIESSIINQEVLLKININGKISDIYAKTKAGMSGILPNVKGTYKIKVEALDSGIVQLSWKKAR